MKMSSRFIKFLIPIALFGLLVSPFLDELTARFSMLIFLCLASFAICFTAFSLKEHGKEKTTMQLIILPLIFIILIFPIFQGPTKFLKWEFVSEDMLLFNMDIEYDALNERLIFFQNPDSHHAFYPLSYVLGKILYDLTDNAYLVHLLLRPALSVIMSICLLSSLLHKVKNCDIDNSILLIYCGCIFLISYVVVGGVTSLWSFRTVGYLVILALLVSFTRFRSSTSNVTVMILLVVAIIMSESIYLPIGLLVFLLYLYYLTRDNKFLGFIRLMLVIFLAYQSFIGFISYVTYGNYLSVLKAQFMALLEFDPSLWVRTAITERSLVYPLFDRIFITLSHLMIYSILPLVLIVHFGRKLGWTKVAPLLVVFTITNALNIGARLIPNIFVNNIGAIFIYSYFPLSMLSLGFYVSIFSKSSTKCSVVITGTILRGKSLSTLKRRYFWLITLFIIIFFSSVNTLFVIYPKSVNDPIEFIDDDRVTCYNTYFVANFLNNYWNEKTSVYYHITTHLQERFLKEEIRSSLRQLNSEELIITFPMLPTTFEHRAEFYRNFNVIEPPIDIIYDQGKWVIICLDSRAR